MKTSPRISALALTATALLAISACGGSDSRSEAAPRTKNAALPSKGAMITKPNRLPSVTLAPKPTTTATPATTAVSITQTTVCDEQLTNADKTAAIIQDRINANPKGISGAVTTFAPPVATYRLDNYSAPTTTQVKNCVATAAVVSTTTPTTLAPTTTASAKTNIAPVVTSAPTTAAQRPTCDAVSNKRRLC